MDLARRGGTNLFLCLLLSFSGGTLLSSILLNSEGVVSKRDGIRSAPGRVMVPRALKIHGNPTPSFRTKSVRKQTLLQDRAATGEINGFTIQKKAAPTPIPRNPFSR
jgi:hypothetical protein